MSRPAPFACSVLAALSVSAAAYAQFDPTKTPIELPPLGRYNGSQLEPVAVIGDNSDFDIDNFLASTAGGQSFYHDLDTAGGYLFAASGRTFEIFDISPIPSTPNRPLARIRAQPVLPFWSSGDGGGSFFLNHVRAATDDLVAIGMGGQGLSIWNTTSKFSPRVAYQDKGVLAKQMHIVFQDNAHWAFVADAGSSGGLMLYNLTNAEGLNRCVDDSPSSTPCSGVFQSEIGDRPGVSALAGAGDFLAVIPPGISASVEILDVSSPRMPTSKLSGRLASFPESVTDVAIWQADGKLYLATVNVVVSTNTSAVKIYDATCATTPGACSLPAPLVSIAASDPAGGTQSTLSASSSGARHFLYVGNSRRSGCKPQREYLFDVTNPSSWSDVSPSVDPAGYWGWFYMDCATGFNNVKPWRGYFSGDTFFRAAHSGLDAHRLIGGGAPPVSSFSCVPAAPSVDEVVSCTDASTGAPDQWSWTFQDGNPSTSTNRNPTVSFTSTGAKQVTLVATNDDGPSANTAVMTINVGAPGSDEIFTDGFESGDSSAWSTTVPTVTGVSKVAGVD